MTQLLFDISVIADGLLGEASARTGIFRYAKCLALQLAQRKGEKFIPFLPQPDSSKLRKSYSFFDANNISQPHYFQSAVIPNSMGTLMLNMMGKRFSSGLERRIEGTALMWRLNKLLNDSSVAPVYFSPHSMPPIILNKKKIKTAICIHDIIPVLHPEVCTEWSIKFFKLLRKQLPQIDGIICVSESTRNHLFDWMPELENKPSTVIHHAADDCFSPPNKNKFNNEVLDTIKVSRPFFLAVGTIEPRKNLNLLLESYAKLIERHGDNAPQLIICGPKGWSDLGLNTQGTRLKILDHISFTGYISNEALAVLYSSAICLIFPSLYEGFGLPVLEAISSGAPVLCSSIPILHEILGDAALFFNPSDSNQMMECMERIFLNKGLRADLISLGFQRAKLFSWTQTADKTFEFISTL